MRRKNEIPVFVIEEHHEVFIAWNYAIQQGWMPAIGNCLFHVDEHSDMGTPKFNESILSLNGDIEKIKEFTYQELNIASFIMPACYRDIFNQVYWIRQKHKKTLYKPVEMFIQSYNQAGKRLLSGKMKNVKKDLPSTADRKSFDYFQRSIEQVPSNRKVILDIDLDYFSCSGNPNELEEIYIEITQNEFYRFMDDKYNRLKFSGLGRVETLKKDDKYFYVINKYNEIYSQNVKVDKDKIAERIKLFIELLHRKNVSPLMIDICRSRYSGYTPKDQYEYIEDNLVEGLKQLYNLNFINVI